jgi:hypothetical protein
MRKLLATVAAVLASALIAFAASVPQIPSSPTYSEPSQIIPTLNTLINQLNGGPGYTGTSQNIAFGSFTTCTSATTTAICNAQRGIATFTSATTLVTGTNQTYTITDSSVLAASQCFAQFVSGGAANSAPYVTNLVPTAGSLSVVLANGSATATGAAGTFVINFNCL